MYLETRKPQIQMSMKMLFFRKAQNFIPLKANVFTLNDIQKKDNL